MRKHWVALAAITAWLVCIPVDMAVAREGGNLDYRSVIDRVTPNVPGVDFGVPACAPTFPGGGEKPPAKEAW